MKKANQRLKKEIKEIPVVEDISKNPEPAENKLLKPAEQKDHDEIGTLEPDDNFNTQAEIKNEKIEESVDKKLEEESKTVEPNEDDGACIGPIFDFYILYISTAKLIL